MLEPLQIYVLWHSAFADGLKIAEAISSHFDALGMTRDGVKLGVPVRVRSEPFGDSAAPRPIDLAQAEHNILVVLTDRKLMEAVASAAGPRQASAAASDWRSYIDALLAAVQARGHRDLALNLAFTNSALSLPGMGAVQALRLFLWAKDLEPEARLVRILLHLTNAVGHHLKVAERVEAGDTTPPEEILVDPVRIFLSHAKLDGWDAVQTIKAHLEKAAFDLTAFVDAFHLPPGRSYLGQFKAQIRRSVFLAIGTDAYGTRPFCRWEILRAKEYGRPILIASGTLTGEHRIFPYAGNVPSRRLSVDSPAAIDALLLAMMSEVLRRMLWQRRAEALVAQHPAPTKGARLLPYPPELVDLAFLKRDAKGPLLVVYPDPPLGSEESELLDVLRGNIEFRALSELGQQL